MPLGVLVSGAGLLALATGQLWRAAEAGQVRAELAARDQAEASAVALRAALERPGVLAVFAPGEESISASDAYTFRWAGGGLEVPAGLGGWVADPPGWERTTVEAIDPIVRERLQRADRLEFGTGGVAGAREAAGVLQEALARRDLLDLDRLLVRQRLRWLRWRWPGIVGWLPGESEGAVAAGPTVPETGPAALAELMLDALEHRGMPARAERVLLRAPTARALAAVDRIGAGLLKAGRRQPVEGATQEMVVKHSQAPLSAAAGFSIAGWRLRLEAAAERREHLRRVQALARAGRMGGQRVVAGVGDQVLFWFPEQDALVPGPDGTVPQGSGALVPVGRLLELLRSGAVPDQPTMRGDLALVGGGPSVPGARPVIPGLLEVRPAVPEPSGFWASPRALPVFGIGLGVMFGAGLFLTLRTLRREADANAARAEFLTAVTHELRTPMASIRLVAEMLADGTVQGESEREEYLGMLGRESQRLTLLLENVLDLRRLERGERVQDLQRHDLGELVADVLEVFRPVAEREGVALTFEPPENPVPVEVDRTAIQQALLNLLDNARKYGGIPGDLGQGAAPATVLVTLATGGRATDGGAADGGHLARVRIADRGPGVPASERVQIFARFARGRQHRDSAVPGVGLGLHLARALARAHGGNLIYVDQPMGACFELRLPIADLQRRDGPRPQERHDA